MLPCAQGYFKNAETLKCETCKGGCKSCTSKSNCFECMENVAWSVTKNDPCTFDCDTTCEDGKNGIFKCGEKKQGEVTRRRDEAERHWCPNGCVVRRNVNSGPFLRSG